MPYEKLYIRINCIACDGSRLARAFQSPVDNRWSRCPYCDPSGKTYVSVELTALKEHISTLDTQDLKELKAYMDTITESLT